MGYYDMALLNAVERYVHLHGPFTTTPASSVAKRRQRLWLTISLLIHMSQQKCIMIFALVCCFAVLVALIFSAVDIWGEDEDGITEENCSRTCRVVLVENIPEDVSFPPRGPTYLPLTAGLHDLLDRAMRSLEIVSPVWLLNSSDYEASSQRASLQGRALLTRLQGLKARGVQLKISSEDTDSTELSMLARLGESSLSTFPRYCPPPCDSPCVS
ncbi:unnamed protein product [Arctogadus glacialis]